MEPVAVDWARAERLDIGDRIAGAVAGEWRLVRTLPAAASQPKNYPALGKIIQAVADAERADSSSCAIATPV